MEEEEEEEEERTGTRTQGSARSLYVYRWRQEAHGSCMVIILLFGFSHMKSSPENWNLDGILYLHQETATSGT